jgi:hypothetical protein
MDFKTKYLKYKSKYLDLKRIIGAGNPGVSDDPASDVYNIYDYIFKKKSADKIKSEEYEGYVYGIQPVSPPDIAIFIQKTVEYTKSNDKSINYKDKIIITLDIFGIKSIIVFKDKDGNSYEPEKIPEEFKMALQNMNHNISNRPA